MGVNWDCIGPFLKVYVLGFMQGVLTMAHYEPREAQVSFEDLRQVLLLVGPEVGAVLYEPREAQIYLYLKAPRTYSNDL